MKKLSNKFLIITLLVLVAAFVLTKVFRSPARESNIDAEAFKLDTAQITRLEVNEQGRNENLTRFEKKDNGWTVTRNETSANAKLSAIKNMLSSLAKLEPERIVTRKADKWDNYQVDDTTGIKVVAYAGDNELISLLVGKETGGNTYVRVVDEEEVYAVDGLLQQTFKNDFDDVRDPSLLRLDKKLITRISFQYPADSGFVVEKKNNRWMMGNEPADSVAVETYLNVLQSRNHTTFADNFKPTDDPDIIVTFHEGDRETILKAWNTAFYEWVFNSTLQPDTYFKDDKMVLAREILLGKKKFLGKDG